MTSSSNVKACLFKLTVFFYSILYVRALLKGEGKAYFMYAKLTLFRLEIYADNANLVQASQNAELDHTNHTIKVNQKPIKQIRSSKMNNL